MKNKFKTENYTVIKKAISKDLAIFLANYFSMKKQVLDTCLQNKAISPFEHCFGYYEGEKGQVPGSYANYGDIAGDTLLLKLQPIMEETTGLKLYPNYSYERTYTNGHELKRHIDRFSCEISTTIFLGGDEWPIFLEPSGEKNKRGIEINLKPGDMLIYKGNILEHWREPFQGDECVQIFLHYTDQNKEGAKDRIFDDRMHLGLPSFFKKNQNDLLSKILWK
jgi:hypothetical protein